MTKRRDKSYALDQCALYRCSTRKKLFKLLQTSSEKFAELKAAPDLYKSLRKKKKDGTFRPVLAPRGDLKRIQRRIGELLLRVKTPDYLMSPVRGRSNIDNAARHRGAAAFHLLDIEDFYPSCTASKVAWFFGKYLGCPPEIRKGKSGRLLRRPRQHYAVATVAEYCSAVHRPVMPDARLACMSMT